MTTKAKEHSEEDVLLLQQHGGLQSFRQSYAQPSPVFVVNELNGCAKARERR